MAEPKRELAMPLLLDEITIAAFRGLAGVTLTGLGRVNVLVGENDTGKSSVLEAVRLLLAPTDPGTWIELCHSRRRGTPMGRLHSPLRMLFPAADRSPTQPTIRMSRRGRAGTLSVTASVHSEKAVESESAAVKDVTVISGSVVGGSEAPDLRPYSADSNPSRRLDAASGRFELRFADGGLTWTVPAPETPVRWLRAHDSEDSRSVVAGYSRAQLGGSKPDFLNLIRLIDPRVSSLELLSPDDLLPELFAACEGTGPMPLSQFGDGLWQGLRVATAVAADRGGVVLVDEFDSALHYSALLDVSRWWIEAARRFDVQLFLTTHSLEALDALLASVEGRPEDLVVFRLDKTESGVVARRFDEPTLRDLRVEGGLELR